MFLHSRKAHRDRPNKKNTMQIWCLFKIRISELFGEKFSVVPYACQTTMNKRSKENGIESLVWVSKTDLNEAERELRLEWTSRYVRWTEEDWKRV